MGNQQTGTQTSPGHGPKQDRLDRILKSIQKKAKEYAKDENTAATAGDQLRPALIMFSQATQSPANPAPNGQCYWDDVLQAWVCPGNSNY